MKRTIRLAIPALLLLVAVLLGGPATGSAQAHPSTFPDVAETDPAHKAIEALVAQNIVAGTLEGTFLPNDTVTRGQTAKIIALWRGAEPSAAAPHFADVDDVKAPYAQAMLEQGWMTGFADGSFRPYSPLLRQQMVVMTIRSLGWEDEALQLSDARVDRLLGPFYDEGAVSPAARPHLALAIANGLVIGNGDRLYPVANVTRAQLSLVVYRADGLDPGSVIIPAADPATDAGGGGGNSGDIGTTAANGEAQSAGISPGQGLTPEQKAQADFMDTYLFQPHSSPITGQMVVQNADWYGIPVLSQLVIIAAETSLGDPDLGGAVARNNNFGCLRYHGADTPWGLLSSGRVWVAGRDWYSFATPQAGMAGFGRYLKAGADGRYVAFLSSTHPDWESFAAIYYGRGVSGFSSYVARLHSLENSFRSKAADHGVSL